MKLIDTKALTNIDLNYWALLCPHTMQLKINLGQLGELYDFM